MSRRSYRRDLERLCAEYGYAVVAVTGSGHLRIVHQTDRTMPMIIAASTTSDHRSLLNLRALMRRFAAQRRAL